MLRRALRDTAQTLVYAGEIARVLRPRRRPAPGPYVPACPTCQADVRATAWTPDALDDAGARGHTWECVCGTRSRWDLDGEVPILLAWVPGAPPTPTAPTA